MRIQKPAALRVAALIMLSALLSPPAADAKGDLKESVVKIYTVSNRHDYARPWQMQGQSSSTGSGSIIDDKRVLTSAHVVADHTFVQVERAGQAKKYVAQVEIIGHESDLAILRVEDATFFEGTEPLRIGDLPEIRDKVATYGFPTGGTKLAITEGVVSRVENLEYSHSSAYLLCCQIDAPINPGSSGGPVMAGDRIVGVAFQGISSGQDIGYMVPPPVIQHFLEDIKDGKHDGTPALVISVETLENPDIRKKCLMAEDMTGVLVTKVHPKSPAIGHLEQEDVVLKIDGFDVENDGTVEFRKGERTFLSYAVQRRQIGETVPVAVLRKGEVKTVEIPLTVPLNTLNVVPRQQFETPPTYYIVGGFVFCPATANLLQAMGGYLHRDVHMYYFEESLEDRDQVIAIISVLSDEVNVGYQNWQYTPVKTVNGKQIRNIHDVVEAIESNTEEFHRVDTESDQVVILSREKAKEGGDRILERYKIASDRSKDLEK